MRRIPVLLFALAALWLAGWSFARPSWNLDRVVEAAARRGPAALRAASALREAMTPELMRGERVRVEAVNDFYNHRLQYRDDLEVWGEVDYWASPLESLERGMADCEDYAIAKYFTLAAMGIPESRLRLVYARLAPEGSGFAPEGATAGAAQPHMVLAYYPAADAEPVVLDNLQPEARPAGQRPDLKPVFSFNAEGLWEGMGPVPVDGARPAERLSRWRDVLAKAHEDGFFD